MNILFIYFRFFFFFCKAITRRTDRRTAAAEYKRRKKRNKRHVIEYHALIQTRVVVSYVVSYSEYLKDERARARALRGTTVSSVLCVRVAPVHGGGCGAAYGEGTLRAGRHPFRGRRPIAVSRPFRGEGYREGCPLRTREKPAPKKETWPLTRTDNYYCYYIIRRTST